MTETAVSGAPEGAPSDAPSDAALISAVRAGDTDAYGELYRRHVGAAERLARSLSRDGEADDLVSEAFAKVLVVLQRGEGPDTALRPYLLTALRRLHVDRVRAVARTRPVDDLTAYDTGEEFEDTAVAGFESGAAAKAFASLPERWQLVLWHLEVEGQKPAEVAPLLGLSANSVSALGYRAREGLRQAFVAVHAQEADDASCAAARARLGAFIRNDVSKRDGQAVEAHLRECRECAAIYLELVEVNSDLRALIAPVVLGAAAAAYLSGGAGVAGGAGVLGTLSAFVADNVAKSVAAGAATTVVVAGLVLGLHTKGDDDRPTRDTPSASDPAGAPAQQPRSPAGKPARTAPATGTGDPRPETATEGTGQGTDDADPTAPSSSDGPGDDPSPQPPSSPPAQPEPTPTTPVQATRPAVASSASGTGGLAWVVDIDVDGLASGQRGTLTVSLDRPAAALDLDPRCDPVGVGRVTCRLDGPGRVRLVVTPAPGAPTTVTSVLQPGGDRSAVILR